MGNTIWKSKTRSFQWCIGCLSNFLSEHNKNLGESYMGKTPLFEVLTNTEYICPPIGPLNHAHHGANSTALLPGCMWNRMLCVCCSGVGGRLIWNWLSWDQLITQSIPPWFLFEVLSPQIGPLSHLLLPKLSTLVDCWLRWMAQHLQAFCMLLATHRYHIVVIPLSSSNCRHPIAILEAPQLSSSTVLPMAAAVASSLLPLPLPLLFPSPSLPLPSSPSLSTYIDVVQSSMFNCHPWIAAVVFINIFTIDGSSIIGIAISITVTIAIAIAIAFAVFAIAVVAIIAVNLLLNLEAARQGRSVLFSDEQKLLFKGSKKGFA